MDNSLEALPPLRDIIREFGLSADKSLGQNFILDQNLTDKIVRSAGDISDLHIFEIGPGPGGLTRSILRGGPKAMSAVEYDERAVRALQSLKDAAKNRITLVHDDALSITLETLAPSSKRAIIANLPYNIATPLLLKWLREIRADNNVYQHMTLMFQKEFADRIVAKPNTKAYGRLSVISQWLCDVHVAFDLSPSAFVPPPKVTSSVVHFRPKSLQQDGPLFKAMEAITGAAFQQRRKMIRGSLKDYLPIIHQLGIEETKRAEDLSVEDYIALAKAISLP